MFKSLGRVFKAAALEAALELLQHRDSFDADIACLLISLTFIAESHASRMSPCVLGSHQTVL
ncbi:MAG: hypothetical protein JHC92_06725 [Sphingomonadaceae bacterium]|nr:hypothetical protein [Sphingomonadaceae bacterium]